MTREIIITQTFNDLGICIDVKTQSLVRCKDCKKHGKFMGWCSTSAQDDFCSYAVRREDGENE